MARRQVRKRLKKIFRKIDLAFDVRLEDRVRHVDRLGDLIIIDNIEVLTTKQRIRKNKSAAKFKDEEVAISRQHRAVEVVGEAGHVTVGVREALEVGDVEVVEHGAEHAAEDRWQHAEELVAEVAAPDALQAFEVVAKTGELGAQFRGPAVELTTLDTLARVVSLAGMITLARMTTLARVVILARLTTIL